MHGKLTADAVQTEQLLIGQATTRSLAKRPVLGMRLAMRHGELKTWTKQRTGQPKGQ